MPEIDVPDVTETWQREWDKIAPGDPEEEDELSEHLFDLGIRLSLLQIHGGNKWPDSKKLKRNKPR